MSHLIPIEIAQGALILVGAFLQIIAIRSQMRGSASHGSDNDMHAAEDADALRRSLPPVTTEALTTHFERMLKENGEHGNQPSIKAGDLTSTSKVSFVQNFKFRS